MQRYLETLDSLIERFENALIEQGVDNVALPQLVKNWEAEANTNFSSQAITELLRVWLEYRFAAHKPVTPNEAQSLFPNVMFSDEELQSLKFEYQRLSSGTNSPNNLGQSNTGATSELPEPGETWEDFLLLEILGEGAFARVYLARQLSMAGRLVALKLTFRATLESQLLARLHHSAIVPIYSMHQLGPVHGLCMPYLGNTTLMDLLKEILPDDSKNFGSIDSADGVKLLEILVHRQAKITTISNFATSQDTHEAQANRASGDSELDELDEQARLSPDAGVGSASHVRSTDGTNQSTSQPTNQPSSESTNVSTAGPPPSEAGRQNRILTAKQLSKLDYVGAITWIGAQLADALDHAHRHGVLHCDIKPANVLLAPDGQARLLDFNVSLEDSQASSQMRFGGTLAYMAPEHLAAVQGKGEPRIDARSDIYSLGIVLFEMLSGTVPKQQASDGNIPVRQLLRAANPAVTPALAAIVHKCLANDPDQRYSSAGQLYEDLNAQCNSLPLVHQAEPSIVERTNKWVRRHPLLTSVSSTSLVAASLMLLTLVGFVWRGRQLERLERASRGSRLEQLLPDAISLASATRNYPELADQARAKSMEVLSLLDNQNDHTLDLSILADQTPLQTLVRLSKANQPEERLHELKDKSESDSATDSYSSDMKRLEAAVEDLNLREVASDEILDAYLEGRFADVTELGTQLSGARASDYATWMFLGQSNLKLENFAAARECFSVCVTLRPSLEIAWFYRGIARLESKQHAAAIADFSHAIELKPDFPSASYNLALAYQAQGETESALQSLNQAINSGWRSVSGFAFRSQLYAKLGMQAESEQDLNNALACRPTSELDWVRRGTLRLSSDLAGAKQDFEQAVAINPRSILARQNLAHVLAEKLAQPEASLEHLDALTELDASNAERWASRGVVLARLGRLTSALRDLSHASTLKMSEALVAYQVACGYSLIASQMDDGPSEILTGLPSQSQIGAAAVKWYKYSLQLRPDVSQIAMTDNDVAWLRNQPEYLELIQSTKSTSRD